MLQMPHLHATVFISTAFDAISSFKVRTRENR
jgi:hypothetical protein